jgi:hypothetical protein
VVAPEKRVVLEHLNQLIVVEEARIEERLTAASQESPEASSTFKKLLAEHALAMAEGRLSALREVRSFMLGEADE